MSHEFQVRDPVHGFIRLREAEVKLIDTPVFQRLRGIRQLAMANLVYPGALHTRFDHSLGVCHVAGLLAKMLGLGEHEIEIVRLAALLHDLGHGPFSHVSEQALERYSDRAKLQPTQKREKIHELITAYLILETRDVRDILGSRTKHVVDLLGSGYGRPVLRNIVSGPLDADKQDYLLRDSRFCGVEYGRFDLHQLHRSLCAHGPTHDEEELMIRSDGIHAVEQYVLAKYYLTTNVYRHRVRLITDQMIVRAIRLGIEEDDLPELRRLYEFDGSPEFFENYQSWNDFRVLDSFSRESSPASLCGDLLRRLCRRDLLKRVFFCPIKDVGAVQRDMLLRLGDKRYDRARRGIKQSIAEIVSAGTGTEVDPRYVIVHSYTIRSVRITSRNDEASIMVLRNAEPHKFEDESVLFASIDEGYREGYVEVYAPVSWDTKADRLKMQKALRAPIKEVLDSFDAPLTEGASQ